MIVGGRDVLAAVETQRLLSPELDENTVTTKSESGGSTSLGRSSCSDSFVSKDADKGAGERCEVGR
jgi:hypothetical protein